MEKSRKISIYFILVAASCVLLGASRTVYFLRYFYHYFVFGTNNLSQNGLSSAFTLTLAIGLLSGGIFCLKKENWARLLVIFILAIDIMHFVISFIIDFKGIKILITDTYASNELFQKVPFSILELQLIFVILFSLLIPICIIYYFTRTSVIQKFTGNS